jgi:hypothetical protein
MFQSSKHCCGTHWKIKNKEKSIMESLIDTSFIAPCGMNYGICMAYLRDKNKCPGCRGDDFNKPVTRVKCKIKNCLIFQTSKAKYCFEYGGTICVHKGYCYSCGKINSNGEISYIF